MAAWQPEALCSTCTPSPQCKSTVHAWATRYGKGFWVGVSSALKRIEYAMPALLECQQDERLPTIIDVGAASHGQAGDAKLLATQPWTLRRTGQPNIHPDDSDALVLLSVFGHRAAIHAFEPNVRAARLLGVQARDRFATRNFTAALAIHAAGLGDDWAAKNSTACGRVNRFTVRTGSDLYYNGRKGHS